MNPTSHYNPSDEQSFLHGNVSRGTLIINIILALAYFAALISMPQGQPVLFWLLIAGQIFHLWQLLTFIYTIWDTSWMPPMNSSYKPSVDVFITVAGEPADIVAQTVQAAIAMRYPTFKVYILNDGYVAKKDNWQEIEEVAMRLGASCITRTVPGGAKAGNINNALSQTCSDLVVVFDADHVPHDDFLEKTIGYFADPRMGFVQSPQYYKNQTSNQITQGSWEQQALFFGPICRGKNRMNAVTMCGTNMVIRRTALAEAGNVSDSIAEDFLTGIRIHARGWKSCYVPEVLAEGLAPEDFLSYYKQQFRWARGAMDVLIGSALLFSSNLTFRQKIQYLSSVSYFVSGVVVLSNALIPLIFFFTGVVPLQISTLTIAALFLPYIFVTLYVLQASSNFSYSFRSLAFSMAGFHIHIAAIFAKLIGRKNGFSITSKRKLSGNFIHLVAPQIIYVIAMIIGIAIAIAREGITPSVTTNIAWATLNATIFIEFIRAALPQKDSVPSRSANPAKDLVRRIKVSHTS